MTHPVYSYTVLFLLCYLTRDNRCYFRRKINVKITMPSYAKRRDLFIIPEFGDDSQLGKYYSNRVIGLMI